MIIELSVYIYDISPTKWVMFWCSVTRNPTNVPRTKLLGDKASDKVLLRMGSWKMIINVLWNIFVNFVLAYNFKSLLDYFVQDLLFSS